MLISVEKVKDMAAFSDIYKRVLFFTESCVGLLCLLIITSGCLKKPVESPSLTDAEITTGTPFPGEFILIQAQGADASITLAWTLANHAQRYSVKYRASSVANFTEASGNASSPFTITGLSNGTSYRIKVTAINGTGEIDSNELSANTQSSSAITPTISFAGAAGTTGTITNPMVIAPTILLGNGSVITNCNVAPALPSGLSIHANTCVISGTPTVSLATTTYTVTAFNGIGGSVGATVNITINPKVPEVSYALSSGTVGTIGNAMSVTPTLSTNGAAVTNCVIAPALPAGLSIDVNSCVISGTPTVTQTSSVFSVQATNSAGTSNTSFVTLAVTPVCPTGYVGIPGNVVMGTDHFCVMQYEAKCAGSSCPTNTAGPNALPTSAPAGLPWTQVSMQQAKAACDQLGFQYDLISNPEWMTIARHVELVPQNWSGGAVNSGCMYRGNVGITDSCSYNGSDPEAGTGRNSKASLRLANGQSIWDFSGNVWELTDWSLTSGLQVGPTNCPSTLVELSQVMCPALSTNLYLPISSPALASKGLGFFYGGSGGAAIRGGNWSSGNSAGAFALFMANSTTSSGSPFGFRCVWRPNVTPSAPVVSYLGSSGTVASIGNSMSVVPTTLSSNGSVLTNCLITPALPAGLTLDPATCVISGVPTAGVTNQTYSVVASNAIGSSSAASVTLTTNAQTPTLSYSGAAGTAGSVGVAMSITPTTLNNNGAAITNCSVSPALPTGLTLHPTTCVVSGTPISLLIESSYNVRAQNSAGESPIASVTLSVSATPVLSYAGASGTNALVGQAISVSPTTLNSYGTVLSCVSTPTLPVGLSINTSTCVISGTALSASSATYSIVATTSMGASAPALVTLNLNANAPFLSYLGASGTIGTAGVAMNVLPTSLINNGDAIIACGVRVPTLPLPAWASVNPLTCAISGTPTTSMATTTFTLQASNTAGTSADALVNLRVNANIPTISYVGATGTVGVIGNNMNVAPTTLNNNGSAITFCSVTPTLPTGLSLHPTTCVVSGTPISIFAPTTYSIRATNGVGQSLIATLDLTSTPSAPTLSYSGATGTTGVVGSLMLVSPTTLNTNGAAITNCSIAPALPAGLTLNTTNCSINGTPVGLMASTAYTITATNSEGSSPGALVSLRVIATPTLSFIGSTGTTGVAGTAMSITPTTLLDNGSPLSLCSSSPALPTGLTINSTTCVISGSPSVVQGATAYNITAYNSAGASSAASVTLTINAGVPTVSFAGALGTNGTVGIAMSVSPTTLNNNGAAITNCTVAPALPAGLSINTLNCVISGTPAGSIAATSYSVTAINSQGSSTAATVTLSTGANAPVISYAGATGLSAAVGVARSITPTTLNNNGSPISNCTISPALPAGLTISTTTCVISGTVATTFSTSYSVIATNGAGQSLATSVTIASVPNVPTISFAGATGTTGVSGSPMSVSPTTLVTNGAAISNCTSTPALPTGLSVHPSSCVISGTPTTTIASTGYTINAINSAGTSAGAVVNLTINPGVPQISYTGTTGNFGAVGVAMSVSPTALNNNGSAITNCTVTPALPTGLSIDINTCVISGTPSASVIATSYAIIATNGIGASNSASVIISTAVTPPILSYAGATGTFGTIGSPMSVTPTTLNDNGAAISACGIRVPTTALPAWASVDPFTCVISGTPNASLGATLYTLVATNISGDSADATVTLGVGASPPSLSYVGSTGTSGVVGTAMLVTPTTLSTNGAAITNCTSSPTLPSGLTLNTSTCVISGTPTVTSATTTYNLTATNSAGPSVVAPVSLTITAGVPVLSFVGSTGTTSNINAAMSVTPTTLTTNGAAISNCTVTPTLPTGLVLNTTTCVISGTPTLSMIATAFQVTATNASGNSLAATVTLTINSLVPNLSYAGSTGTAGLVGASMTVTPTTLNTNGAGITNCTVSPALPTGLSLNTTTCVISGAPIATLAGTPYSVTASNAVGPSTSASVTLSVTPNIPQVSFAGASGTNGTVGVAMLVNPTTLNANGAVITSCVATPALPAGLSINNNTCAISGTPVSTISPTIYSVTAGNLAGSSIAALVTLSTGVNVPSLSFVGATGTVGTRGTSMSVTPTTLSNNGATITNCTSSPTLHAGLTLNTSTCVISGVPTVTIGSTVYNITASNSVGNSSAASVTLTISAGVPLISYVGASGTNGTVAVAMTVSPTTLNNNGAAITGCSISPSLPAGLSLNSSTCVISGTPVSELTPTSYSVTASNSAGASLAASVTLSTGVNAPTLSFVGATGTTGTVGTAMSVSPTGISSNGATITQCLSTPALPAGLTLNATSCIISGTPSAIQASTSYNLVATNSAGSSTPATVSINIIAGVPALSYSASAGTNGSVGVPMSITPSTLNNRGAAISNCSVTPTLPAGLSLNTSTCVISGTPSGAISPTTFSLIATNSAGMSAPALVTLSTGAHPPTLSYAGVSGNNISLGSSFNISPTTLAANGAVITGCTSSPALPAGVVLNATTCVVSGTPTGVFNNNYNITAENSAGDSIAASLNLVVTAGVPTLSFAGASGTNGSVGVPMSITPTTLVNNGAVITGCLVDPALPSGLSINATTCVISGTPVAPINPTVFSVRAQNATGLSLASIVTLSTGSHPPTISFSSSTGTTGQLSSAMLITPSMLADNGSVITNCTTTPALPAGLSINTTTCVISGTPTGILASTSYNVTVTNAEGSDAAAVTLTINPIPPSLSYAGAAGTNGTVGFAMTVTPTTLINNGSAITNCTVTPALPAALSIHPTTCVISGAPSASISPTAFSVIAANSAGQSSAATVTLSTTGNIPDLSYAGATGTSGLFGVAMSVAPTILNTNGGSILSCGIKIPTTALPAWASVNASTCVISGTPNAVLLPTLYTLVANNMFGDSADATVTLDVDPNIATLSFLGATGTTGEVGEAMSVAPTTLNANGAAITNCTITPALPAGLTINTTTCVISGTPISTLVSTSYTVTAINSEGSSTGAVVSLIVAEPPTISYAGATGTTGNAGSVMTVTPTTLTNGGLAVTSCTSSPALPTGLTINSSTCVISGTPSVVIAPTAYTITASNAIGASTGAAVTLQILAGPPTLSYVGASGTTVPLNVAMTVTPTVLANNGSAITNCQSSPALPAALTLNTTTCVITGSSAVEIAAATYTITATNINGTSAGANVTLGVSQCPIGYVNVPGDGGLGTSDFCVMEYEAKCSGSDCPAANVGSNSSPVSTANGTPWIARTLYEAKMACRNLGVEYDLISNEEWMTIARNAENQNSNWPAGTVGSGCMKQGNVGLSNTCAYDAGVVETGTGRDTKAQLQLSNGSLIWDLSGNVSEWIDWSINDDLQIAPQTCISTEEEELLDVSCLDIVGDDYLPDGNFDSLNGMGMFYGDTGGAAIRGGGYDYGETAGIYTLLISQPADFTDDYLGFRCVWRSGQAASAPYVSFDDLSMSAGAGDTISILPVILLSNGSPITDCDITPALPAGLTIDQQTCVISGTPVADSAPVLYTVTATNAIGLSNAATLTISLSGCPTGYVGVPGNAGLGTTNFCVMQYEAKCDGDDCPGSSYGTNNLPISTPETIPWTGLDLAEAKTACRKLGHKYDLISNEEWMTIARNAEVQASNWPSTVVGSGCIRKGNDSTPGTCGYDNFVLDFGTSRDTKARLNISNGSQIWDLAGNAMEWVDWSQASGLDLAPLTCISTDDEELIDVTCPALNTNDYRPVGNYDSTDGIGMFFGEDGGATIRGGSIADGNFGGLYSLLIAADPALQDSNLGFRCVWRAGATPEIPTLAYEDGTVTVGIDTEVSVAPAVLLPNGAAITDCQITPALPAGFTLDSETCVVNGFNNNGFATNTYSIVASNSIGDSVAASLTLASGACPEGFVEVPGNAGLGTDNFCVMQFEAKCEGINCPSGPPSNDARAVSTANSLPWTGLDLSDAKLACTNLGARFDLISNQEWMTIARNVELQASNWPSGVVGSGCIKQGNNDNDDTCGYEGGALLAGTSRDTKSQLVLSNSSEIWDLSGNALEWVDWSFSSGLDLAPQTCISPDDEELGDLSCPALSANDYLPSGSYSAIHGVGMFYGDSGGAPIRGGGFSDGIFTGVYSLIISEEPTVTSPSLGFRCVWRPD